MSDWKAVCLSDVADIKFSNVDKKSLPGEIGVQLCNYMDVYSNDYVTRDISFMEATATPLEIERFKVESGDVIITKDSETPDDIGIPAVVVDDIQNLVCGYHLALIKPLRDKIDPVYLTKQIASSDVSSYYARLATGSTRYGLSSAAIAHTPIPLAPLAQQSKIAKILITVDSLIGKTQTLIDKYQSIKQGMMHDLFTCGVDENGQLRPSYEEASHMYKESELGWIPREWEVDRLGAVGSFKNGLNKDKDSFGFGTKFVNISDVFPEKLDISSLGRMDATEREQEDYKVSVGDILLDRSSVKLEGVGYPTIFMGAKEPVVFCGFIIRYQIQSPDIIPEFLLLMMRSPAFRQRLIRVATQSANVNINQEALSGVLVAVPTQKEQKKSIDVIECINRDISTELEYLNKLSKLKAGLMQDLLSGKVRVKVDA